MTPDLPTFDDVQRAAKRLHGVAHRTPVLTSRSLDAQFGAQFFFKAENLQRTGAFKFRGAYNALSALSPADRARGVLAYSSGNHAQAIALAGRLLDIHTTIVMPADAPKVKVVATQANASRVIFYDRATQTREAVAAELLEQSGATLIPPYDHRDVIAGQGTAAKELFESTGPLDVLLVCVGGGGLLSGCALAARALSPATQVIGSEPSAADDAARSFHSGVLQRVDNPQTIADGAMTPSLGTLTFPMVRTLVDDIVTVSDDELIVAMRWIYARLKVVVEPTGALAAAAAFTERVPIKGRRVGIVLSGGNIDLADLGRYFSGLDSD